MRTPRKDMKSKRARRAISYLFERLREDPTRARLVVEHAEAYSVRHRVPILAEERALYCPACHEAYTADSKRRVRGGSLYVHCERCGALRRLRAR